METYAFSYPGRGRRTSEDSHFVKHMQDGTTLLAVADGMCGGTHGEQAVRIIRDILSEEKLGAWGNDFRLSYLVKKIDRIIHEQTLLDTSLKGMGTTITAVFRRSGVASWVHVGNSRFYVWRDWKLLQITADSKMLLPSTEIGGGMEDGCTNVSTREGCRCVGFGECDPTTGKLAVKRGDLLLLATDGFYETIPPEIIFSLLQTTRSLESKAMDLSQMLLNIGCEDDATVVMAQI